MIRVPLRLWPRRSLWAKAAVIVWTARRCAWTWARPAGAAWALSATGAAAAASASGAARKAIARRRCMIFPFSKLGCGAVSRPPLECPVNPPGSFKALPVPGRIWSLDQRPPFRIDEHFAPPDMVGSTDHPFFLHPLDQPRGIIVADAQLALEVGGRSLLALGDDLDGLAEHLRLGIVLADRLAVEDVAAILRLFGDRLDIIRMTLPAPEIGHLAHLLVGDEGAVDARDLLAARHVEHVALAEQLLGALLAENGTRIDLRGARQADARR